MFKLLFTDETIAFLSLIFSGINCIINVVSHVVNIKNSKK